MQYESNHSPQRPERFAACNTPEELTQAYNEVMAQMAQSHDAALARVALIHEALFAAELHAPGSQDLDRVLNATLTATYDTTRVTAAFVGNIMDEASEKARPMLSDADRHTVDAMQVVMSGQDGGTHNEAEAIRSQTASPLVWICFDRFLLDVVRKHIKQHGQKGDFAVQVLALVSHPSVLGATQAALDADVFDRVSGLAFVDGADSDSVTDACKEASTGNAAQAMYAAFDRGRFYTAYGHAAEYGANSEPVYKALRAASSRTVRKAFAEMVGAELPDDPNADQQDWSDPYSGMSAEDLVRAVLRGGRFSQPPKEPEIPAQRQTIYDRLMEIIRADDDGTRPWPPRANPPLN